MEDQLVTVDGIMAYLRKCVEEKIQLHPSLWVDAALKLVVLLDDEHDLLFKLEQAVAVNRVNLMKDGMNATQAKMHVEALDEYREAKAQKARIGRIDEMIRIAKVQARMRDNGYGHQ